MLERAKFNMPFRVHVAMHFASGSQCVNIVRRQWNEHWENGTELQFCHNIIEYEICVNVFRVQVSIEHFTTFGCERSSDFEA